MTDKIKNSPLEDFDYLISELKKHQGGGLSISQHECIATIREALNAQAGVTSDEI